MEGRRLGTVFELNVKGMTAFPGFIIDERITAETGGTTSEFNDSTIKLVMQIKYFLFRSKRL